MIHAFITNCNRKSVRLMKAEEERKKERKKERKEKKRKKEE